MKPFTTLSIVLLALLSGLQLVRFIAGWPVSINDNAVPVWCSAVFAAVAGLLSLMAWRESRRG